VRYNCTYTYYLHELQASKRRAMAESVIGVSTGRPGSNPGSIHVSSVSDNVAEAGFPQITSAFSCQL